MTVSQRVPLSVLDLAIVSEGGTSATALADTTQLARQAEALGYIRFWVAEHHNMPIVASTNPAVLIAHLAASTHKIKIGSGGVMLPDLPTRTRLFRLFKSHRHLVDEFLAEPSMLGVIDSYGIELLHPIREGRSDEQVGRKGISNHRWIVGGKLCYVLNHLGLIVSWDCDTANVHDGTAFQHLVDEQADVMVIFADTGFAKKDWHPTNLRLCQRSEWNDRRLSKPSLPC